MGRMAPVVTVILMSCFAIACCCDLNYICDRGRYHVVNPDPSLFIKARTVGCQTEISLRNTEIFVRKCQTSNVTLELITAQGYSLLCPLFCEQPQHDKLLRRRRAAGDIRSLKYILEADPNGYANYHCHASGPIFIKNPRPELYYYSVAERIVGGDACKTKHVLRNEVIEIYDCDKDHARADDRTSFSKPEGGVLFAAGSSPVVTYSQNGVISRQSNTFLLDCETSENQVGGISTTDARGLQFECFEDGTITVTNPRSELFRYSFAESDLGTACQTIYVEGHDRVIIFDCERSQLVVLIMARDPITGTLIIRPNNVFIIDC